MRLNAKKKMDGCFSRGRHRRLLTRIFRSSDFAEGSDEEGLRAVLIGPTKVGAGEVLSGITAPTFSAFLLHAPVLELVDRRDLHSRDRKVVRVLSPAGALFPLNRNLVHNIVR